MMMMTVEKLVEGRLAGEPKYSEKTCPSATFFLICAVGLWVLRPLTGLLYETRMIDDDCGEIGGMKIGRGTEVLGENLTQRHFFFNLCDGTLGTAATYWPIVRDPDDR
jgi:hypothetical protein